ncbi:hypothetical protein [Corynebacterium sp. HMSC27B11]|uniref:hypothetical protein n=1 Tax=Corynebacterium sp. HMSC27B11 TaxID=1581065 RepID=UPI0008A4556E|nr:hypothetical protein [Corynebacterium sp. HMSC27B11]OFS18431.1 hypothetical protein HMPREF3097_01595 [Corynebacterium sp. HMSC27B11]
MTTPGNSERDVARSSTPATDAEMSEATTDGATPAPHEPTENTPQDSTQGDADTDPNNGTTVEREDANADTAASPDAGDSPEATDEDGTEADQNPEELDEDDRPWRENLASDMKSPMGKLPTWGWMAIILTVAVIAAIAFGILFMGKAKTTAEANESPTGAITPSRPAATTTSKYERDPNAGAPNGGYVDPGYVDPGYYEPAPEPEETTTEPSEETTSKAPSSKRKPSSNTPKPPAQGNNGNTEPKPNPGTGNNGGDEGIIPNPGDVIDRLTGGDGGTGGGHRGGGNNGGAETGNGGRN